MIARISSMLLATPALLGAISIISPAAASDQHFFQSLEGQWNGPGEIVAGKYKGTKFVCNFQGDTPSGSQAGITMDGACRVGVFSQKMSAVINQKGNSYTGRFLDGAKGEGLDVVSGNVRNNSVVIGINRKKLDGAMVARLTDPQTMNVSISVKVGETLVPVIGMTLSRKLDTVVTGSLRQN